MKILRIIIKETHIHATPARTVLLFLGAEKKFSQEKKINTLFFHYQNFIF